MLIACAQLATLVLAVGPYPHERGQRLFVGLVACVPMPTWAMICVIAEWIVGWSGIGAWRMMTRDA